MKQLPSHARVVIIGGGMVGCHLPTPGRMTLAPLLSPKGRLYGDLSLACLDPETCHIFGSGAAREMHRRWIESHLPENGVTYRNRSDELHGIAIAGPRSRELLSRLMRTIPFQ